MDVTQIIAEYGAYYEQAKQNKDRILSGLTQGLVTPGYCTSVKTDDTIYRLAQVSINSIVQAFQKKFTPKGEQTFTPKEIRLYQMKADLEIEPDEIEATWLGFLADEKVSRKDWPIIKYMLEHENQGVVAGINRDMEMYEYGHGKFVAPTPSTAAVTGQSMKGYIELLQEGVDDDTMKLIPVGLLDKDTIFEQVEEFVEKIPNLYRGVEMPIFMSQDKALHYHRDKRGQNFYQIASDAQVKNTVDFVPQYVVGLPSLNNTEIMFATPKPNFLHITKKFNNKTKFDVQGHERVVKVLADWWEGLGFGINEAVFTNLPKSGSGSASV